MVSRRTRGHTPVKTGQQPPLPSPLPPPSRRTRARTAPSLPPPPPPPPQHAASARADLRRWSAELHLAWVQYFYAPSILRADLGSRACKLRGLVPYPTLPCAAMGAQGLHKTANVPSPPGTTHTLDMMSQFSWYPICARAREVPLSRRGVRRITTTRADLVFTPQT